MPPREAVQLSRSKLQAYRYANLRPSGLDEAVTLFTVPTSEGVATLACVDPGADCEAIAEHAQAQRGDGVPGRAEQGVRGRRSARRSAAWTRRSRPGAPRCRARRRRRRRPRRPPALASAYNGASKAIAELKVSPADAAANAQLAASLKETGAAYGKLAAAARSGSKSRYKKARTAVQRGEQAVAGALRGLQAAGYKIAT